MRRLGFGFCLVLIGLSALASAAAAQGRPPPGILAAVAGMDATCREAGGRPGDRTGLLQAVDLTGDGRPDWILNEIEYVCEGTGSLFSGSGGGQIAFYRTLPSGDVGEPYDQGALGVTLQNGQALVTVGGAYCGQADAANLSRSQLIHCRRPIVWNSARGAFEMGARMFAMDGREEPSAPAAGVTRDWLIGVWVPEGGECDSGQAIAYDADGTTRSEFLSGTWRLDGDLLIEDVVYQENYEGPGERRLARSRLNRLGPDQLRWTADGGSATGVYRRCRFD